MCTTQSPSQHLAEMAEHSLSTCVASRWYMTLGLTTALKLQTSVMQFATRGWILAAMQARRHCPPSELCAHKGQQCAILIRWSAAVVSGCLLSEGTRHFTCRPMVILLAQSWRVWQLLCFVPRGTALGHALVFTSPAVIACLPLRNAHCLLCRPMVIARPSSFVPKGDGGVRAMVVVEHTARPLLNWMVSRLVDTVRGDKIFLARANAKDSAAQVRHIFFFPQALFLIEREQGLTGFLRL